MTPQLMAEVQKLLDESKAPNNKGMVRALELIKTLSTRDVYIANRATDHLISLLKK